MNERRWQPIYFGLGSNLDQPARQLQRAVRALAQLDDLLLFAASSVVSSPPVDGSDQPDYLNVVVAGMTRLAPLVLLDQCQQIERSQGRDHAAQRWSARPLDIDLLFLGQTVCDGPRLDLPHKQLAQRAFVLAPLAEIAPAVVVPGFGSVQSLLRGIETGSLTRVGKLFPDDAPVGLS